LQAGNEYRFRVAAVNAEGNGAFSEYVQLNFQGWRTESNAEYDEITVVIVIVAAISVVLIISAMITYLFCQK
jgi:hypothetical protein